MVHSPDRFTPSTPPLKPGSTRELNVLAIFKGAQERRIFVYDDTSVRELLRAIRELVFDTTSAVSGADAIELADRVHIALKTQGMLDLLSDHP